MFVGQLCGASFQSMWGIATFAPHRPTCREPAGCTKAKARRFTVFEYDEEFVAPSAAWLDEDLRAKYRKHRPMVERSISWLVAKANRTGRCRGVERNEACLHRRVAGLKLRKVVVPRAHAARGHMGVRQYLSGPSEETSRERYLWPKAKPVRPDFTLNSGSSVRQWPRESGETLRRCRISLKWLCPIAP
jgi:hypothetical protein